MVGVGRDLCGSSSPTLLPKQGHLQQAARDCVQAGLEYLQRRRVHNLPGQPVPVLHHPQRDEVLPHVQTELLMLQFVPVAPCLVAGHHWKEFDPILLTPTLEMFVSTLWNFGFKCWCIYTHSVVRPNTPSLSTFDLAHQENFTSKIRTPTKCWALPASNILTSLFITDIPRCCGLQHPNNMHS